MAFVKSVLTSEVTDFITPLVVLLGILQDVNKLEHAFIWPSSDKMTNDPQV